MLTEPNIQRASNQTKLVCPICERAVENHTELESNTCIHVRKITPIQHAQDSIPQLEACDKCLEQETALTQLWSLIQDRAHPTNFTWRCTNCNQERQLTIN